MILFKIAQLKIRVENKRSDLTNVAMLKGITHPDVIKASQELDMEIVMLQKFLQMLDSKTLNKAI